MPQLTTPSYARKNSYAVIGEIAGRGRGSRFTLPVFEGFEIMVRWVFDATICLFGFQIVGLMAGFFFGVPFAQAVDHNATHIYTDSVGAPIPELTDGHSVYTLAAGSAHSGKVLDEVYLMLTFKSGEVPSLNRVLNVSYGADVAISSSNFHASVTGQKLYLWYGFEDRPLETNPSYVDQWKLTLTGDSPLAKVETYIGYHGSTAIGMPSLYGSDDTLRMDRLKAVSITDLVDEWSDQPMPGGEISSSDDKVVVLVHGWNPKHRVNHYGAVRDVLKDSDQSDVTDTFAWRELEINLLGNPVIKSRGWKILRYDWHEDAATGPKILGLSGLTDNGIANANAARDAANAHGYNLASLLNSPQRRHIHFICHSAGNWAARRAIARLKFLRPDIQIQLTSLDAFVNDADIAGGFDLQPAFEMLPQWANLLDNYYVSDSSDINGGWTSGDFAGGAWNNCNLESLGSSYLYDPGTMASHGGPVAWYAKTANRNQMMNSALRQAGSDRSLGFLDSLAVRDASYNDHFANADDLGQAVGVSKVWFNYCATSEASEPEHSTIPEGRSVWGKWTAPSSGTVTIDTLGSDFYTVLAIYTGNSLGALSAVGSDTSGGKGNGMATVTFNAVGGQTYRIAVDGIVGSVGKIVLNSQFTASTGPAPVSVSISSPIAGAIVSGTTVVSATAIGATSMEFYLDGELQAVVAGGSFVWNWSTEQTLNGQHAVSARAYSGVTLLGVSPAVPVTISNATPPTIVDDHGNSSAQATALTLGTAKTGFISSPTDVDWFKVDVTTPGVLTFNLAVPAGKDYDLELFGPDAAYVKGSYGDTGAAESISQNVTVANVGTYFVRVYGYPVGNGSFSATDSYSLTAHYTSGVVDIAAPPQPTSVPWGASAMFSVNASNATSLPMTYQWQRNGIDIPGAVSSTYATPPTTLGQSGDGFTVCVTTALGSTTSAAGILTVTDPVSNIWTGAVSNDWDTAGNWGLGHAPNGNEVVRINGGSIIASSISAPFTIVSNGSVISRGSLGGNMTVASGATLILEGAPDQYNNPVTWINGTLTNAGTVIWQQGHIVGNWNGTTAAAIINQSGGLFEVRPDTSMYAYQSAAYLSFTNAGTLRRTTGTATASISVPFTNTGTIEVQTGTLQFNNPTMINAGPVNVSAGAEVSFGGSSTILQAGSVFTGAGTVNLGGNVTTGPGVLLSGAGSVFIAANITGPLNGNGMVVSSLGGDCTISGSVISRGQLGGNVTVASGATLILEGAPDQYNNPVTWINGTLTNAGTVIWQQGHIVGNWNGTTAAAIINQSGGLFEVRPDTSMYAYQSAAYLSFTNAGTLRRTTGTATASISVPFTNTGTIEVQTGTLQFNNPTMINAGPVNVSAGAEVSFGGSSTILQAGSVFTGAGTVNLAGATTVAPSVDLSSAGAVNLSGNITGPINGNGMVATSLGGDCTITGSVTSRGNLSGSVTVANGGTLVIEGAVDASYGHLTVISAGTLTNFGTVIWQQGYIRCYGNGTTASAIVNQPGGVFEVRPDTHMDNYNPGGTLTFTNAGTLRRTTGTGTAAIYVPFTSTGTIEVQSGTLAFSGTFDNTGTIVISPGAQLIVNGVVYSPSMVFTTQPQSQTVTVGGNVTFTAEASGSPTYQWQKDNVNISGATNSSYTVSSATTASAGNYSVIATNSSGSVTSNIATLTVNKILGTVTLGNLLATYDGLPHAAPILGTTPIGLTVALTYNGSATAPTNAGSYAVVATINDPTYTGTTSGILNITKANPVITWAAPSPIASGTPLSPTQLNATANVGGTFIYSPASGAVLGVGDHLLTAAFTPADQTNYANTGLAQRTLTVQQGNGGLIPIGFDVQGYLARYPDVAAIYGTDLYGAWIYYRDYGVYQGQIYDELFRVEEYLALYPELFAIFGTNLSGALMHWLNEGSIEGRLGRIPQIFSAQGYFDRNPDVAAAVGGNPLLAWQHYWAYGIYEGRAYDDELYVFEYLAVNADLTAAFVNDWRAAALHWMRYGRTEGRLGRLPLLFDVSEYLNRYPDVGAAWGTYPTTVFLHFWLYGINEGKTFDNAFRVDEYLALNPDLATVFGTDRRGAFKHWVRYGQAEGRPGRNP